MADNRTLRRALSVTNMTIQEDNILVRNLFDQEFILLIGSEAIFEKDFDKTQGTGDSMFWLYNAYGDAFNISKEKRPLRDHDWQILLSTFADAQKNCRHILDGLWGLIDDGDSDEDKKDFFRQNFCKPLSSDDPIDHVEKSLIKLLSTNKFRIVFTTCVDDILELVLLSIWGDKLDIYNFQDTNEIKRFIDTKKRIADDKMLENNPCLVYLFGKIGAKKESTNGYLPFVFSEDDALKAIARYIKQGDRLSEFCDNYLPNHPIMSIGCHFDDWRFRFFWYALNGRFKKSENMSKGTVAYPVIKSDDPLKWYLTQSEVQVEPDSRLFMERLVRLLSSEESIKFILNERRKDKKGVFISYASEEFNTAYGIFKELRESSFNVWIDHEDLHEADKYEKRIKAAIEQCDVFMPILGRQAKKDLNEGNKRYYMDEWEYAYLCKKKFMPITWGDYSQRENYHQSFLEKAGITGENDIHIKPFTEMDGIIKDLNNYLLNIR